MRIAGRPMVPVSSRPQALVFADVDVSGRIPIFERPEGRRAFEILKVGFYGPGTAMALPPRPVHHIITKTVDRLGRNAKDALGLYEWFQNNGKSLTSNWPDISEDIARRIATFSCGNLGQALKDADAATAG